MLIYEQGSSFSPNRNVGKQLVSIIYHMHIYLVVYRLVFYLYLGYNIFYIQELFVTLWKWICGKGYTVTADDFYFVV